MTHFFLDIYCQDEELIFGNPLGPAMGIWVVRCVPNTQNGLPDGVGEV